MDLISGPQILLKPNPLFAKQISLAAKGIFKVSNLPIWPNRLKSSKIAIKKDKKIMNKIAKIKI